MMSASIRIWFVTIVIGLLSFLTAFPVFSSTALEDADSGMQLIEAGDFANGWPLVEKAREKDRQDRKVKIIHESQAFYILKKIIENRRNIHNIDIDRLLEILLPYTHDGIIVDPFYVFIQNMNEKGRIAVIPRESQKTITIQEARQAKSYPTGKETSTFAGVKKHETTKINLKELFKVNAYRSWCMYFDDQETAEKALDMIVGLFDKTRLEYPVAVELYHIANSIKPKYGIYSSYLLAISESTDKFDDLLTKRVDIKELMAIDKLSVDSQSNPSELMEGIRQQSTLLQAYIWQ